MNKKAAHIVFPVLLIANLLFSQVALNFLHSKDSEQHEAAVELQAGQYALHHHAQHCKVCAVDVLFHLLISPATQLSVSNPETTHYVFPDRDVKRIPVSFTQGRAPPSFIC